MDDEALEVRRSLPSKPPGTEWSHRQSTRRPKRGVFLFLLVFPLFFLAFCFLFYVEECPVDPQFLRRCVGSIMKLDQKSKVKTDKRSVGIKYTTC